APSCWKSKPNAALSRSKKPTAKIPHGSATRAPKTRRAMDLSPIPRMESAARRTVLQTFHQIRCRAPGLVAFPAFLIATGRKTSQNITVQSGWSFGFIAKDFPHGKPEQFQARGAARNRHQGAAQ